MVSQPHGQGPREPRQSQRPRPKRSRSHSKTKALELGQGGHLECKIALGISAAKILSLYSSSLPLNQICLSICPLAFLLTSQCFLPIFSSTNSRKGITLAYQIIIIYIWTIFVLPCHVRDHYYIFPRPFSTK